MYVWDDPQFVNSRKEGCVYDVNLWQNYGFLSDVIESELFLQLATSNAFFPIHEYILLIARPALIL
jgi:hypothetical protein